MFCGPSWDNLYRVPLCSLSSFSPKRLEVRSRVARQEDYLFRRLFPAGPEKNRNSSHCLPAEIGPLVTCRTLVPFPALGEAGTAVPITQAPCTSKPSRKRKIFGNWPVDNGDIGNNSWNDFRCLLRLPICSPCPTSTKCLNRQRYNPNLPISKALTRPRERRC